MSLDKATVAGIASLAHLHVDADELTELAAELSQILEWVKQLEEIDTARVEPMTSVAAQGLRLRADKVTEPDRREEILANAPERVAGFFTVPKVVE
ncbi:MAG: Asp-tRNA(Asn)/Glu-tRNA(Gln) amidotransferase subunit GatC [Pseudomonadota bacterium]